MSGIQLKGIDIYDENNEVVCYTCGLSTWDFRYFKPRSCEECPARLYCLAEAGCPFELLVVCHHCRNEYQFIVDGDEFFLRFNI